VPAHPQKSHEVAPPGTLMDVRMEAVLARIQGSRARGRPLPEASAHELVKFYYGTRHEDAEKSRLYREGYPFVHAAFERTHGRILSQFYARHSLRAVLLTDRDELEVVWDGVQDPRLGSLLSEFDALLVRAHRLLKDEDRTLFAKSGFGLASRIFSDVDAADGRETSVPDAAVAGHRATFHRLTTFVEHAALRRARMRYVGGASVGFLLVALTVVLSWFTPQYSPGEWLRVWLASGAAIGGGLGALLSVVQRLQSGNLEIDYGVGPDIVWWNGVIRPLVGVASSLVILVLIGAGWVPLPVPEAVDPFDWFTAIGFFAGFSERWARDTLSITPATPSGALGVGQVERQDPGTSQETEALEPEADGVEEEEETAGEGDADEEPSAAGPREAVEAVEEPSTEDGVEAARDGRAGSPGEGRGRGARSPGATRATTGVQTGEST